jgi:formylglycine-generating enzyme required for sulfatase activity
MHVQASGAPERSGPRIEQPPRHAGQAGMVWIPGGVFTMGSDRHYPEERPSRRVAVDGFWIERHPVTNLQFAEFVEATGHVTTAEIAPKASDYPGALPEMLYAGSMVFTPPPGPVDLRNIRNWWSFVRGADWRHPRGHQSSLRDLDAHPVVHVTYEDAKAYARWAGKSLPTEVEWEFAARGGLDAAEFAWGTELHPDGREMANTWQGQFPWENLADDGWIGTSPVGAFPPNEYGLYDMIGNVWEWTTDWYTPANKTASLHACCVPHNPLGPPEEDSYDPNQPGIKIPRKVIKGGSHLCAPNYCRRYRPAARFPEPVDTSTCHVGFRCVVRGAGLSLT